VALSGVGGLALLEIESGLMARALERLSGSEPETPAAIASSALEQSLLALSALIAIDACRSASIDRLVPRLVLGGDPAPGSLAVALQIEVGAERGRGLLLVPPAAVVALGSGEGQSSAAARLAIPASLRRGTVSLAFDELSALASGDVVLLDPEPSGSALVFPGGLTAVGGEASGRFQVEEIRMTETQAAYPLTLSVEIARVVVTLGELSRLAPGAVLALDARKDGAVVLRAGERAVARGQLVDVEGALGVRIAELGALP
jgi:type III secretion protein Q